MLLTARLGNFAIHIMSASIAENDDYLNSGGVQSVGILNQAKRQVPKASLDLTSSSPSWSSSQSAVNHKSVPENLYLQGYGRQFGEKMTYSVGLSYGSGRRCSLIIIIKDDGGRGDVVILS